MRIVALDHLVLTVYNIEATMLRACVGVVVERKQGDN